MAKTKSTVAITHPEKVLFPGDGITKGTGLPKLRTHWVKPQIVVQVAFTEWTPYDKLRHPRLLGLRPDKAARDVVREDRGSGRV